MIVNKYSTATSHAERRRSDGALSGGGHEVVLKVSAMNSYNNIFIVFAVTHRYSSDVINLILRDGAIYVSTNF